MVSNEALKWLIIENVVIYSATVGLVLGMAWFGLGGWSVFGLAPLVFVNSWKAAEDQ